MTVAFKTSNGIPVYEPPYKKSEIDAFYRVYQSGKMTIYHGSKSDSEAPHTCEINLPEKPISNHQAEDNEQRER